MRLNTYLFVGGVQGKSLVPAEQTLELELEGENLQVWGCFIDLKLWIGPRAPLVLKALQNKDTRVFLCIDQQASHLRVVSNSALWWSSAGYALAILGATEEVEVQDIDVGPVVSARNEGGQIEVQPLFFA